MSNLKSLFELFIKNWIFFNLCYIFHLFIVNRFFCWHSYCAFEYKTHLFIFNVFLLTFLLCVWVLNICIYNFFKFQGITKVKWKIVFNVSIFYSIKALDSGIVKIEGKYDIFKSQTKSNLSFFNISVKRYDKYKTNDIER